jgi:hypothetical protein
MSTWKIALVAAAVTAAVVVPVVALAMADETGDDAGDASTVVRARSAAPATDSAAEAEASDETGVDPDDVDGFVHVECGPGIVGGILGDVGDLGIGSLLEDFDPPLGFVPPGFVHDLDAAAEKLAQALRDHGIDVPPEQVDAVRDALDQVFAGPALGDGFVFGEGFDLDDLEIPSGLLDELNAQAEELAAHLDAAGIDHAVEEGPMGVKWVDWDRSDPDADAAAKEFFEEKYGDFDCDVDLSADIVSELNAHAEELAQALREAGIDVTMETDDNGLEHPVWDEADDDAANKVIEEFWRDRLGELVPFGIFDGAFPFEGGFRLDGDVPGDGDLFFHFEPGDGSFDLDLGEMFDVEQLEGWLRERHGNGTFFEFPDRPGTDASA